MSNIGRLVDYGMFHEVSRELSRRVLALDVTDKSQVAEVVRQAEAKFVRVGVPVNPAGLGYLAGAR